MPKRGFISRGMILFSGVIALILILLLAGALWFGGAFSPLWLARSVLAAAAVTAVVDLIALRGVLRPTHVVTSAAMFRRVDSSPGCSFVLLVTIITLSLFVCGALLFWTAVMGGMQ